MPVKNDKKLKQVQNNLQGILKIAPRAIGVIAQNFFTMNFKRQGFLNNGIHAWPPRKNDQSEGRAILVGKGSGRLMRSIRVIKADQEIVVVGTDVPYAKAHNEGAAFKGRIPITEKSRKFFWAMFYQTGDERYKRMALTKKTEFNPFIKIPKRQFIGNSKELTDEINTWFKTKIQTAFK